MRTPVDAALLAEIRRFRLRFTCADCLYRLPAPDGDVDCAHGWPTGDHARAPDERSAGELVFCKEFELK